MRNESASATFNRGINDCLLYFEVFQLCDDGIASLNFLSFFCSFINFIKHLLHNARSRYIHVQMYIVSCK